MLDMRFSCNSNFFNNSNDDKACVGILVSSFPPKLSLLSLRLKAQDLGKIIKIKLKYWEFSFSKLAIGQATHLQVFFLNLDNL